VNEGRKFILVDDDGSDVDMDAMDENFEMLYGENGYYAGMEGGSKLKHTPIENPKLVGCLNCSPVPSKILPIDKKLWTSGGITLKTDNHSTVYFSNEMSDKGITLKSIIKKNKGRIEKANEVTLFVRSALHDETYELNKEDGNWYLIKQGLGYA